MRKGLGTHSASIVVELEVALLALLGLAGLAEGGGLAQVVGEELVLEGLVRGLGEHALFLQDGQDTHGLRTEHIASQA